MEKIKQILSLLFIASVVVFSAVSILGIWDMVNDDVVFKSLATIGLLGGVGIIVISAMSYFDKEESSITQNFVPAGLDQLSVKMFISIREMTISVLVISLISLALLGVMSIWEILDTQFLMRSLASMAVISFASGMIIGVCLQREHNPRVLDKKGRVSGESIFLILFFGVLILWLAQVQI